MPKIHKSLYEFLLDAPAKPITKPAPTKPDTPAKPIPRPTPIRRDKPSTQPKPQAKEEDLYKKFIALLRSSKTKVKVNMNKLK